MRWLKFSAACIVMATVLVAGALVIGQGPVAYAIVVLGALMAAAWLVLEDSKSRGRGGARWLVGCVILGPVGMSAFLGVAVLDRLRGRPGIEGRWPSPGRRYFLAGVVMSIAAASVALAPLAVQGERFSAPAGNARISGSCSSALRVALAGSPYNTSAFPDVSSTGPRVLAAENTVDHRCSIAASQRLAMSALCLVGVLLVTLVGASMPRRLRPWAPIRI